LRAGKRGESIAQIATALHLSPGTVRNHVSSALSKLAVSSRPQAAVVADERGWI
jgi:two-component system response regulator DesR